MLLSFDNIDTKMIQVSMFKTNQERKETMKQYQTNYY